MKEADETRGTLRLVSTPIGNLADLSPRAREALETADLVLAEDTRRSARLLSRPRGMKSYHDHNSVERQPMIREALASGGTVALVTDAGTPGISDPCFRAVRTAIECGARVEVVPGPCAAVAALVGSGLPVHRFCFEGFPPEKSGARASRLAALASEPRTMIFYIGPHDVRRFLGELAEAFGGSRRACLAREITKLHEEFVRDTLEGLASRYSTEPPRGEVTLVVAGCENVD